MDISETTRSLVARIEQFSGNKLTRVEDFRTLVEVAAGAGRMRDLDHLCFLAKFLVKTRGIMQRIGPSGEGFDTLSGQFSKSLAEAVQLLRELLSGSSPPVEHHFTATYLGLDQTSLQNLMNLLHDLSWYKNWQIDNPSGGRGT